MFVFFDELIQHYPHAEVTPILVYDCAVVRGRGLYVRIGQNMQTLLLYGVRYVDWTHKREKP